MTRFLRTGSTEYTQNNVLLKILRWEQALLPNPEDLRATLSQLRYCSETEIVKHLRPVLDALFGILASGRNHGNELSKLVFVDLVTILAIISDRRFHNFRPVFETYIDRHFNGTTTYTNILRELQALLVDRNNAETAQLLRSAIKVWDQLFSIVVRSREVQRARNVGMGVTSDHLEVTFKKDVSAVLTQINMLMVATSPASVIGTQMLAIQHFAALLPILARIFTESELADIASAFGEAVQPSTSKGRGAIGKLLFLVPPRK